MEKKSKIRIQELAKRKSVKSNNQRQSAIQTLRGYKHPKLGLIPAGWEVHRFADVFEFLPTNSFSRDQMSYEASKNSIYNIHYGDIHATFNEQILDFNKHIHQIPVLIDEDIKLNGTALLKDGDLIIADASEDYEGVGECIEITGINKRKVLGGLHTIAARDKKGKTIQGFRGYLLKHQRVFINLKKLATGSKVYGISKTNVAELELIVPPTPEQQKIARILSAWDKAIEKTEQLIAQKQQLKKGLMQQLLTGKVRFKEFVKSRKMKKTKLGLIPEDWRICEIEDLVEEGIIEKPLDGNHGDIHPKNEDFVADGIPFIMANCIRDNMLDLSKAKYIKKEQADKLQKGFSYPGDVLLTHKGSVGGTAVVQKLSTQYIMLTPQVTYYRVKNSEKIINIYIKYYFDSFAFQTILQQLSGGGTRAYIGITDQRKLPFILPSLKEQKRITSLFSKIDFEINKYSQIVNNIKIQKAGLMQKLLTGQVRV